MDGAGAGFLGGFVVPFFVIEDFYGLLELGCVRQSRRGDGALQDLETLYLDDLCVDEACRGQHVGQALYEAVVELARSLGCYNVTLNVWSCNGEAMAFYERCGLRPQKVGLEQIL